MISAFEKLKSALHRYGFALSAFLIPVIVRSIPAILSWPYAIGFDTATYFPAMQSGWVFSIGPLGFLKTTGLFYLVAGLPYELTHDPTAVLAFLAPILLGLLCFTMYLYARKALSWSGWKSLLLAVLVSTYFVSLRNSWDLYRQTLGLIFLVAAFVSLKSFSSPRKYYFASVFMVLTVLSHELAAVILFFVVGLEAFRLLAKKYRTEFVFLVASVVVPFALFLFQRFSPQSGGFVLPNGTVASEPSFGLAMFIGGSLVYCYAIILPLVFLGLAGLKDWSLRFWTLLCLGVILLEMLNPALPFYFWNRWVLILVYPLLFFAVQGLDCLWRFSARYKSKIRCWAPKFLVIAYLLSLLVLSGYYLTTSTDNPYPYFYQYNPYLTTIPSTMLQNSVPIQDNPSLVSCLEWLSQNTTGNSVLVEHYALYDLAKIYVHDRSVISVPQDSSTWSNVQNETVLAVKIVTAAKVAFTQGHSSIFTVWWIDGKGWYGIPSLPLDFKEVYRTGNMAVYVYAPLS